MLYTESSQPSLRHAKSFVDRVSCGQSFVWTEFRVDRVSWTRVSWTRVSWSFVGGFRDDVTTVKLLFHCAEDGDYFVPNRPDLRNTFRFRRNFSEIDFFTSSCHRVLHDL